MASGTRHRFEFHSDDPGCVRGECDIKHGVRKIKMVLPVAEMAKRYAKGELKQKFA